MVDKLESLRVQAFTENRVPNDFPGGDLPWQIYHTVRNALILTCRRYGTIGPMGVVTITPEVDDPYRALMHDLSFWERGDPNPAYFIVSDQYNNERYCYAEVNTADSFNAGWLFSITEVLRQFEGWGLGIGNIPDSYILIFSDRLLVNGRLADCKTARDVINVAQKLLRQEGRK